MYINEAMKKLDERNRYITRAAWRRIATETAITGSAIRIQPTNSPHACIVESGVTGRAKEGWQPMADDLLADDWECVRN